jgi:two-component system, cell cycle response regulator DivK
MGKARVLIVEDNFDNLALVRYLVERVGYDVLEAMNGIEGIRVAREQHPDLILMDMALPEMDGWAATKEIKSDPTTKDIPIIALTAYTQPNDRLNAQNAGCDSFIAKPLDISWFTAELKRFLETKEQA